MSTALVPLVKLLKTPTWQLSIFPSRPLYWRATQAEHFLPSWLPR
ncbi:MAG: hypothetical protein RLZZ522_499, partial [Verrucomicrobiota bacterium]